MPETSLVELDKDSAAALASSGLDYRKVAPDSAQAEPFVRAVERGFLGGRSSAEEVQGWREAMHGGRAIGIFDASGVEPLTPVATINAWPMEVTIDVDSFVPMWSISAVTVSPTHRRRGIARAMLEGELRAAAGAGFPIAGLTVTEASIYGRYGFGSAVHTGHWTIDARRATWIGPRPTEGPGAGRLDHVEREQLERDLQELNESTRGQRPGDISGWPALWRETAGMKSGKPDPKVRGVRYTDANGEVRGVVSYTLTENPEDFTRSTLSVNALIAVDADAYAALWRYVIEHDLVGTVKAGLRSMDEPLRWMISDERALVVTERDHHWLRILDLQACLQARAYRVPGAAILDVTDPLGLTAGQWRLKVDDTGRASVEPTTSGASEPVVSLGISEVSAMFLGGVRASTLASAGRISGDPETLQWMDLTFTPAAGSRLSYWY